MENGLVFFFKVQNVRYRPNVDVIAKNRVYILTTRFVSSFEWFLFPLLDFYNSSFL